jgi:peroxiredoxin
MTDVGAKAPDFELADQFGRNIRLSAFAGRSNVLILFYPLDWTPT